jgi:hypothetical protein
MHSCLHWKCPVWIYCVVAAIVGNQRDSESFTLKMEAIYSFVTSVLTRTTRYHHIPEDSILHCYRREDKKQTNSVALSPQANYTDWSTATFRQNLVPTFADRGGDNTKSYIVVLYGRLIIALDEATRGSIARSSLPRPSWGTSLLPTEGTPNLSP